MLTGPDGQTWADTAATLETAVPLEVRALDEPASATVGIGKDGAVVVRPDARVVARRRDAAGGGAAPRRAPSTYGNLGRRTGHERAEQGHIQRRHLDRVRASWRRPGPHPAETAQVDALDKQAIETHADAVVDTTGGIDVSFNAVSIEDVQEAPLVEMALESFAQPVTLAMRTQFPTAVAEQAGVTSEELEASFVAATLLRRLPMLAEVGNVAALMASDLASPMTGTVANMTCGAIVD